MIESSAAFSFTLAGLRGTVGIPSAKTSTRRHSRASVVQPGPKIAPVSETFRPKRDQIRIILLLYGSLTILTIGFSLLSVGMGPEDAPLA